MLWRQRIREWGVTLALFALGVQLSLAAAITAPAGPEAAFGRLLAGALCHQEGGKPAGGSSHHDDCALCPLCHLVSAVEHALPAAAPALPLPALIGAWRAARPPVRAPPPPAPALFQARAPPSLV